MAKSLKKTRSNQLLKGQPQRRAEEATEDYLETINSLIDEKGFAASVDIAERMKVSKPTVTSIVKKLDKQGYLVHEKYRGMKLTEKGRRLAEEMKKKHDLITSFLVLFGVEESLARQDAEKIEHVIHPETLEKLGAFTRYILSNPELIKKYRGTFR
ncbi:MAG: MarR family transcriptional regulator [Thaumarchaeota archaeon]|nr:MarR family transcriptional regulator [Nitrososphaerota archaeon]